jgi:hypothetical protein
MAVTIDIPQGEAYDKFRIAKAKADKESDAAKRDIMYAKLNQKLAERLGAEQPSKKVTDKEAKNFDKCGEWYMNSGYMDADKLDVLIDYIKSVFKKAHLTYPVSAKNGPKEWAAHVAGRIIYNSNLIPEEIKNQIGTAEERDALRKKFLAVRSMV